MTLKLHMVIRLALLYMLIGVMSGCAAKLPVRTQRFFWPPAPDVPRIEWLASFSSQLDMDKSASQKFWAAIAGDEQAVSLMKPVEVRSVPELNRFYVSDLGRSAVIVFDLDKHEIRSLVTPAGVPSISVPLSIVVDVENRLYVLDRKSASVYVFDSSEKLVRLIDLKAVSVMNPVFMAIDKKTNRLYVSDASSRSVSVLGLDGAYIKKIGSGGEADGQFNLPISMAVNSRGELIIADAFAANVQIFNPEGRFVRKIGRRGDAAGDFQLIKSVAVDSNDNIYVADGRSHSVTIFSYKGDLLLSFGGFYSIAGSGKAAPGGFAIPTSIDIDATDKIFIVDQMNARVQVFQYFSDAFLKRQSVK